MNVKFLALLALLFGSGSAFAAAGKVTILSPANGSTISTGQDLILDYDAIPGPNGDHLHLNVDGKRIDVIRQLKGEADAGKLPAGNHHVCLAVNTKAHVPTGVEGCIDVTAHL